MATSVVFLDIDGVIAGFRQWIHGRYYDLDALRLLKHLQDQHGFVFVLSSVHRKLYKTFDDFIVQLPVQLKFHEDWKTTHFTSLDEVNLPNGWALTLSDYKQTLGLDIDPTSKNFNNFRGLEILKWLQDHNLDYTRCLVVDDSSDVFPTPLAHFIHIPEGEIRGGLQIEHYDKIDQFFKRQTEGDCHAIENSSSSETP